MRIIAGEFRSRKLLTPKDDSVTRPIPDRVKESLFGLLRGHCEGASVFDAFAGTGAIGLEAVSRGASRCVMVEMDKGSAELLRRNVEALGAADRCEVVVGDALGAGALARCPRPLTLGFFDPPYPLVRDAIGWKRVRAQVERVIDLLSDDGFVVVRTPWPFLVETPSPDQPAPGRRPVRKKKGGEKHWRYRQHEDEVERGGETDGFEEGEDLAIETGEDQTGPKAPVVRSEGDLLFPNATGPETHVYHSMAVHLYMRRRTEQRTSSSD
jgi:16S rRNA (guanine(966)-N(2))-methyltransferase RsmD